MACVFFPNRLFCGLPPGNGDANRLITRPLRSLAIVLPLCAKMSTLCPSGFATTVQFGPRSSGRLVIHSGCWRLWKKGLYDASCSSSARDGKAGCIATVRSLSLSLSFSDARSKGQESTEEEEEEEKRQDKTKQSKLHQRLQAC